MVVLCDECDAVWTSADLDATPQFAQAGELPCPRCEASLFDSPSRWATKAQIEGTDWLQDAIGSGRLRLKQGSAFAPEAEDVAARDDVELEDIE